jgi:hypothetical protein
MTRTLLRAAVPSILLLLGIAACTGNTVPGGACGTCAEVFTNGGITCGPGPSTDAWRALADCACGAGVCAPQCGSSFCQTHPALDDPDGGNTCGDCLATNCSAQATACSQN